MSKAQLRSSQIVFPEPPPISSPPGLEMMRQAASESISPATGAGFERMGQAATKQLEMAAALSPHDDLNDRHVDPAITFTILKMVSRTLTPSLEIERMDTGL